MKNYIVTAMVLLTAGCAVIPRIQQPQPIAQDLSRYSAVQVFVDAPQEIRQKTGYDSTSAELLEEFIANVKASGKYALVGTNDLTGKGLEVRLNITELNYVHGGTRAAVGIFGGRARLSVTMMIKDKTNGSVVGVVSAGDTSRHIQGVFSATTSRQVAAIAKELAAKLVES